VIYFAGEWLVDGVMRIAGYLGWREFVLSFLIMAFIGSLSSLIVGISSAMRGIPQLSLGETVSGNLIDITLVLALPILLTGKAIKTDGKTINMTMLFTVGATLFSLLLLFDGVLSRADGVILIFYYFSYFVWLFSKKERFKKHYTQSRLKKKSVTGAFKFFLKGMMKTITGVFLLIIAAQGIVWSCEEIAVACGIPIVLVGLFIVGIGNALPELYFTLRSTKEQDDYMILGNILGAIITPATLVLGIVAIINPIEISHGIDNLTIARIFLFIACLLFLLFCNTGKRISKKEALILVIFYVIFLGVEVFISF
jgi:cation:H+ antiporter